MAETWKRKSNVLMPLLQPAARFGRPFCRQTGPVAAKPSYFTTFRKATARGRLAGLVRTAPAGASLPATERFATMPAFFAARITSPTRSLAAWHQDGDRECGLAGRGSRPRACSSHADRLDEVATAAADLKSLRFPAEAPAGARATRPASLSRPKICARPEAALFPCRPWIGCKRPSLARPSASAWPFQIEFLRSWEVLRGQRNILRMRRVENGGLCTSRHGSAAACRSAATAGRTVSRTRRLHVGCVRSLMSKWPRSAPKTPKSLPKRARRASQTSQGASV